MLKYRRRVEEDEGLTPEERRGMTVCVATLASNSRAIVMVSDKAVTYTGTTPLQSDVGIKKLRRVGKTPWHALIAGDPTFALRVIEIAEAILAARKKKYSTDLAQNVSGIQSVMKTAYQRARTEMVEDTVLSPRMLSRALFVERGKDLQSLDPEFFSELSDACDNANPGSQLLVCGFDPDEKPHIFSVVNPGKLANHDLTGFHAIGAGARTALARLLMLDSDRSDSISLALYQAFDAKVNAELVQSVGYFWDAEILIPGKCKNVPKHVIRLIDNVYAALPKEPFSPKKKRYKYPRRWESRLGKYLTNLLEPQARRPHQKSVPQRSKSKQ
jgi:20S proteasome alpha/beta subunit